MILSHRAKFAYCLVTFCLFAILIPVIFIVDIENPRQGAMLPFYLSMLITLLLSYLFMAAGRLYELGSSGGGAGISGFLQSWGFPILHRHGWGDFGRLYALFFLTFMAPLIPTGFAVLIGSNLIGFEATVAISNNGAGLSESEAMSKIASGQIPLFGQDLAREAQIALVRDWTYRACLLLVFPCLVRLIPYFFWRSGGCEAPSLAATWRHVSWRLSSLFGLALLAALIIPIALPGLLIFRLALFSIFISVWAMLYASAIKNYGAPSRDPS